MATPLTVTDVVEKFGMQPHPEGGFFVETFRDSSVAIPLEALPPSAGYKVARPSVTTAIYFLVPTGTASKLHRIPSSEVWHFYLGDPLTVVELSPTTGEVKSTILGHDIRAGQTVQHVVPGGTWFGSYPTLDFEGDSQATGSEFVRKTTTRDSSTSFSLVGCTVAPGFEFADFEMAKRGELSEAFPKARSIISALTEE
eukprot:TRINITY_DN37709_c0_g1_i1.p1 TRINITY_DN37709_c0_g1~~TRINITY_DN37709_c0_g1_i1.p1  ORF type:complete len:198 (+),score=25.33 TRINITY_DN37709_c0_g1_i1:325-918(+)